MKLSYPNPLAVFETCAEYYGLKFDYNIRHEDFTLVLTFYNGCGLYSRPIEEADFNDWKTMDTMTLLSKVAEPMVKEAKKAIFG